MKLIPLCCFLVMVSASEAQIRYGVKGGLNLSDVVINNFIDPDAESDFKIKAGLHAGLFVTASVGSQFSLAGELLYSNKGVNAINPINLHYLTVPILVRHDLSEKLIVEGGPELGYLLAARSRYGSVKDVWNNKFDLGFDLGLQYNLTDRLGCGLRFTAGFSSVVRDAGNTATEKVSYQNRALQLHLNYVLKTFE